MVNHLTLHKMKTTLFYSVFLALGVMAGTACSPDIASERIREADLSLRVVQAPEKAGVGSYVSVKGYNLDRVVAVVLGQDEFAAGQLEAQSATEIVFVVPARAEYAGVETSVSLRFRYVDASDRLEEMVVCPDFAVLRPAVTAAPQQGAGEAAKLGDKLTFAGHNLQLLDSVLVNRVKTILSEKTETKLVVELPDGDYAETVGVESYTLKGFYGGELKEELILAEDFRIDNTPVAPTEPMMTSISAADGYYLLKPVVISGKGMDLVDRVEIGGLEAAIVEAETSSAALTFIIPDGFTFNNARDCDIVLFYGGNSKTVSKQMVYPFYYWKNVTLGVGSKSACYEPNSEMAIFCLETGRVISATEYWNSDYDPFYKSKAINAKNDITAAKGTISKSDYEAIGPYIVAVDNGGLSFAGPGNDTGLNGHRYLSGGSYVQMPSNYGTPVVGFSSLNYSGAKEALLKYADSVRLGTLTSCLGYNQTTGSAAPKYKKPAEITANNSWGPNVMELAIGYVGYDQGKLSGASNSHYTKFGFIRVTNITGVNTDPNSSDCAKVAVEADGKVHATVTFDCYWPKNSK